MPVNPADRGLTDEELVRLFTEPQIIPEREVPAFMYDEGMDQRSADMIRRTLDLHVTTVQEQELTEEDSDFRVLAHARKFGYTLIVRDKGFKKLHVRLEELGLNHAGIVWARKYLPPEQVLLFAARWMELAIEKEIHNILYYRYWEIR
jgi:predicted nuclease of predicted toxin-antitoxin system